MSPIILLAGESCGGFSAWDQAVLADSPVAYWPMKETNPRSVVGL